MHSAIETLTADLNARINPERTRVFDRERLMASREELFDLSHTLWPQLNGRRISIVGSNGKGSTAWFLSHFAAAPAGLYTSPHLHHVLERIRMGGLPIPAEDAVAGLETLRKLLGSEYYEKLSYFEILTLLAVHVFQERKSPVQIFEAGLGGRFDATRIARAETVVLTPIELEHTEILGRTHLEILREKLAIASSYCTRFFVAPQAAPELDRATIRMEMRRYAPAAEAFFYEPPVLAGPADYLTTNRGFARWIARHLREAFNAQQDVPPPPGRLEERETMLPDRHGNLMRAYFDVAHTPDAVGRSLRDLRLRDHLPEPDRCLVVLGLLADRNPGPVAEAVRAADFGVSAMIVDEQYCAPLPGCTALPGGDGCAAALMEMARDREAGAIIVLGSHRNYKYFVELTNGGEKTDGSS